MYFRFEKDDMLRLFRALAIPDKYWCKQGTTATGMEALMILLRRLAYPNRLGDLVKIFGRTKPELSLIFNMVWTQTVKNSQVCLIEKLFI